MEKCTNYGLLDNCYFQPNWELNQTNTDPFESALSSMVSSPTATPVPSSNGGDGIMIRELIGRLGSICDNTNNSAEINSSTNTSCYSTPLNSPPSKFNISSLIMMANHNNNVNDYHQGGPTSLGSFNADPGFVERAAKFSSFVNNNNNNISNFNVSNNNVNDGNGGGRLSRVNSEKKMVEKSRGLSPENNDNNNQGDSREGSSISDHLVNHHHNNKAQFDGNSKKRKAIPKNKVKGAPNSSPPVNDKVEGENEETDAKRSKLDNEENINNKEKQNNSNSNNNSKEEQQKAAEPPKDYIHVRARRGQATDSHSLAERVRREKISERMKFLQDLVPGCNKVTGKATVLDEIINYVQSLQRQVEFLSMKLATVNPRLEFNMESLLSKDMFQSRGSSLPQSTYPLDQNSAQAFPFNYQSNQQMPLPLPNGLPNGIENPFSVNQMNAAGIRRNPGVPLPSLDAFTDSMAQLPTFWEDDLHSVVQMGLAQDQTQSVPGTMPNSQMKLEL